MHSNDSTTPLDPSPTDSPTVHRILLVDDHPVFRHGIIRLLDKLPHFRVSGEAGNLESAMIELDRIKPDLALVDLSMPDGNGIDLIQRMLKKAPDLKVIVVSMHADLPHVLGSLQAGAKGYVMKDEALTSLLEAVKTVAEGEPYVSQSIRSHRLVMAHQTGCDAYRLRLASLSERERQVLELLGRGCSTRQAATQLGIGIKTVETHVAHLKEKLEFTHQSEVANFGRELEMLSVKAGS
jgi:DNA-binding NarL/FixJ family response regulator